MRQQILDLNPSERQWVAGNLAGQDQHGTGLAVIGKPGDIRLSPSNLVARRYEQAQLDFFQPLTAEIIQQANEVHRSYGR